MTEVCLFASVEQQRPLLARIADLFKPLVYVRFRAAWLFTIWLT